MRAIDADSLNADCNKYLGILNPDRDVKEYARIFWLISILRSAPTIEPERKKGKWIDICGNLRCSECNTEYPDLYPDYDETNFCPNCGKYMREDQDGKSN